jgi:hypothetical protein
MRNEKTSKVANSFQEECAKGGAFEMMHSFVDVISVVTSERNGYWSGCWLE